MDCLGCGLTAGEVGSNPLELPWSFGSAREEGRGGDPGGGTSYRSTSYVATGRPELCPPDEDGSVC